MPLISKSNPTVIVKVAVTAAIWMILFLPVDAPAQDEKTGSSRLVVGTMDAPPLAMKSADGSWEGLGVELWQAVAQEVGVEYEFIAYDDIDRLMAGFEKGDLDVFIAVAVTASNEVALDLSQPFLTSGLAIAVPAVESRHSLFHFLGHFVDRLASREFLLMIGMLVLLAFVAGTLVWLFESRRNREVFSEKTLKGLWQGLWWAMVTMTTVGYGDKAPKTIGGRVVALIWMFTSIILLALFTAAVTASLTVGTLSGNVQGLHDLHGVRVGAVAQTESHNYLVRQGIAARAFKNRHEGLQAMVKGKIDAFVLNELILKNLSRTAFHGRIQVLPEIFDHYYVSMAMPPGSALREPLNRALLKIIETDEWLRLKARHIGAGGVTSIVVGDR